jgi:hypothetical protein
VQISIDRRPTEFPIQKSPYLSGGYEAISPRTMRIIDTLHTEKSPLSRQGVPGHRGRELLTGQNFIRAKPHGQSPLRKIGSNRA